MLLWRCPSVSLAVGIVLATIGCSTTVDVDGEDAGTFFGVVRGSLAIPVEPRVEGRDETEDPTPPERGPAHSDVTESDQEATAVLFAVELELSRAEPRDDQFVGAGTQLDIDDHVFPGPTRVEHDFEVTDYLAYARVGARFEDRLQVEGLFGLDAGTVHLRTRSLGRSTSEGTFTIGPLVGLKTTVDLFDWWSIYGMAHASFGFGREGATSSKKLVELGAQFSPIDSVGVFAGWRKRVLDISRRGSDFDLDFSGPLVGIQLNF